MPEKINIASLSIDLDDVIKESVKYKKRIDELKASQKELTKEGKTASAEFVENAVQLKKLGKSYRDNQSFATALSSANEDLIKTMSVQNKSTQELRDSRSQLNQISKNIKGNTEEEIELREKLNKAIDAQTEALRGQSSDFNTDKDRIGEYRDSIIEAVEELKKKQETLQKTKLSLEQNLLELDKGSEAYENMSKALVVVSSDLDKVNDELEGTSSDLSDVNFSLEGFINASNKSGGASKVLTDGLKGTAKGFVNVTKSALAFLLTPVGVFLALIAGAFLLVKNAMNRSETATNKIKQALSAFTGILQGVLKFLEPLGNFLIDVLVKNLELVEKGIFSTVKGISSALSFLGFEDASKSVKSFTDEIEKSVKASKALVKAEIELEKAQRIAQKTQLDFQKDAEKLRQIRDDVSKSDAVRLQANEDLGLVLKEQLKTELAIANKALEVAKLRILAEGETKGALDAQAEALTTISDIQERLTGQESEQLVNRVSLQKEFADKAKAIREENAKKAEKLIDEAIKKQNEELDLYIANQGIKKKTLQEQLEFERSVSEKKKAILKAELEAGKISQIKYDTELADLKNEILRKQTEVAIENAELELSNYVEKNKSKLDSEKFLSEELLNEERLRLERLAEQRREFETKRLEEGVISQTEYNSAINEINAENKVANEELDLERREAEAEQKAIDLENKAIAIQEEFENDFAIRQEQLEINRALELEEAEKTGADKNLINEKYKVLEKRVEEDLTDFKINQYGVTFGMAKGFFGEHTALSKAFAIAEIATNTFQNASKAFAQAGVFASNPLTAGLAVNANIQGGLIVASGALQSAKVAGVKFEKGGELSKYSKGDILKGRSHAQGGIPFTIGGQAGFEAEGDEIILTKGVSRNPNLLNMASAINVAGGGKKFNRGGVLGTNVASNSSLIDYDALGDRIAEANASLPSPVVAVTEIQEVASNVETIESIATL